MTERFLLSLFALVSLSVATTSAEAGVTPASRQLLTTANISDGECPYDLVSGDENKCELAKSDPDCSGENFNYLEFYACGSDSRKPLVIGLYFLILFVLFYLLGTTADQYFCPQVEELSDRLGLTPRVAGVTLLSLGNGAPDVFAGIAAVRSNQTALVLGQLTGGGMFVTSVVAGGVIYAAGGIRARFPLLRDIQMYLAAVATLCVLTEQNQLTNISAAILLVYYLVFVAIAYYSDKTVLQKVSADSMKPLNSLPVLERSTTQAELLNKEYRVARSGRAFMGTALDHLSHNSEGHFKRSLVGYIAYSIRGFVNWCEAPFTVLRKSTVVSVVAESWSVENDSRIKASFALLFTPLFLGFWRKVLTNDVGDMPMWALLLVCGLPVSLFFLATCPTDTPPSHSLIFLLVGFLCAALWVDIFASELVDLLTALGHILSISEVVMGATILAWGNCIGDLTADILLAKNKREGMAITACFGGPMFNLLIVVGFGVLLHDGTEAVSADLSDHVLISFGFLGASLVMSVFVSHLVGKCLSRESGNMMPKKYSFVLFALYFAYLCTMVVYEFAVNPKVGA